MQPIKKTAFNLILSFLSLLFFLILFEAGSWIYYRTGGFLNEYEAVIEKQGFTPHNKKPGEKRIFVIGESAVEGIPYTRDQAFPAFLQKLVQREDSNVQIINTGIKGRHSFYQLESAKTFVRYKADAVIIYAGNNDSRDFSNVIRDVPFAWLEFKLSWNSYFHWLIKRRILSLQKSINKRTKKEIFSINFNQDDVWHWTNGYIEKKRRYMEDTQLGLERKQQAVRDYEKNLYDLTRYLKSNGIAVYISELPVNHLTEPGVYDIKKGLGPGGKSYEITQKIKFKNANEEEVWTQNYQAGIAALKANQYSEALHHFQNAEKINSLYALLPHFIAKCYQEMGDFARARQYYVRGKDLQIQSPGADSFKNKSLKNIAEKTKSPWIEIQSVFETLSPDGLVGNNLLLDHCHMNILGNKVIAARMMEALCRDSFLSCSSSSKNWKDWFSEISDGKSNSENIAKEYLMTAFYLINGTVWQKKPDYVSALTYLEKARDLVPQNEQIYPLLAEAYFQTENKENAEKTLLTLKQIDELLYKKTLKEHPEFKIFKNKAHRL